jgi:DNA polymerase III subunit delta'
VSSHPRDRYDEVSHTAAEQAFADAMAGGRLHHGWLLCGPEGVGKAGFAYRAARRLLGAAPDPARGPLGSAPADPTNRLIAAQSHPDLMVLERVTEGTKARRTISVDQARELPGFFSKSPSRAQWRVAIVDSADDLNINAANALLKILEEPPERGVLFLVTHSPGRLLPTIRSRCRRLSFPVWSEDRLAKLVASRMGLDAEAAATAARAAGGSPGRVLAMAGDEVAEIDALVRGWIETGGRDMPSLIRAVDSLRRGDAAQRFELILDRLAAAVKLRALDGGRGADAWADLWSRIQMRSDQTAGLNLDRQDVLFGLMADLDRARARSVC